jgi:hypothetical protein
MNEYYGSVAGGNDYFKLTGEVWHNSNDTIRLHSLIEATRLIDRLAFKGCKGSTNLHFPLEDETVVPEDIIAATYELALKLIDCADSDLEADGLRATEDRFVSVLTKRDTSWVPAHINAGIVSIRAWHRLVPYLANSQKLKLKRT